jgi:hypothetical protein
MGSNATAGHITRSADSTFRENRMLKRRIRTLAVTGTTIVAAALATLGTTAASAATTTTSAPGHMMASQAAEAASGCVTQTFDINDDQYTYEQCVYWEQILLNDLYNAHDPGPNQHLSTDGYYGPDTTSDVHAFQNRWYIKVDGITGPQTWKVLCVIDASYGFHGTYWYDAGCDTIPGI